MDHRCKLRWNLCYLSIELVWDEQGHSLGAARTITVRRLIETDKQINILARVSLLVQCDAKSKCSPAINSTSSRAITKAPSLMWQPSAALWTLTMSHFSVFPIKATSGSALCNYRRHKSALQLQIRPFRRKNSTEKSWNTLWNTPGNAPETLSKTLSKTLFKTLFNTLLNTLWCLWPFDEDILPPCAEENSFSSSHQGLL